MYEELVEPVGPGRGGSLVIDGVVTLPRVNEIPTADFPIRIWLDSGATASLVRYDLWNDRESYFITGPAIRAHGAFGTDIFSKFVSVDFTINGFNRLFSVKTYLVHPSVLKGRDLLLGSDVMGTTIGLLMNHGLKFVVFPLPLKSTTTAALVIEKYFAPVEETPRPQDRVIKPLQVIPYIKSTLKIESSLKEFINSLKPTKEGKVEDSGLDTLSQEALNTTATVLLPTGEETAVNRNGGGEVQPTDAILDSNCEEDEIWPSVPRNGNSLTSCFKHDVGEDGWKNQGENCGEHDSLGLATQVSNVPVQGSVTETNTLPDDKETEAQAEAINETETPAKKLNRKQKRAIARHQSRLTKVTKSITKDMSLVEVGTLKATKPSNVAPKKRKIPSEIQSQNQSEKRAARKRRKVSSKQIMIQAKRYSVPCAENSGSSTLTQGFSQIVEEILQEYNLDKGDVDEIVQTVLTEIKQKHSEQETSMELGGPPNKPRDTYLYWTLEGKQREKLDAFIVKFSDVILQKDAQFTCGQAPFEFDVHLIPGGAELLRKHKSKMYPLKGEHREVFEKSLPEMVRSGHGITNPDPNTVWYAAPMFYTVKPRTTKLRMCVDFTFLNNVTQDIEFPIPFIDDVIASLKGKKVFSIIDLKQVFNQFKLTKDARRYINMRTFKGIFQFLTLPFGPKNGPKFSQHVMHQIFEKLIGVCVQIYIDDIIIYSDSIEEHYEHLAEVFEVLRQNKLVCQIDKCHFLKQLKYLGKVVSGEGVATDPELIEWMVNYPKPTNVKQVRSFLGLCSCYRGFVHNFAILAEPLTELTRSDVDWTWGDKQEKAFQTLKNRMSDCPILLHPDGSKPFYLQTDASAYGAGAILMQKDENGKLHPVAYGSWLFSKTERNYTTTERELLAIVLATRKWREFFYGKSFTCETDHKPLSGKWDWKDPYGKITRWANELRQFDIQIKYRRGRDNEGPDALSRARAEEILSGIDIEHLDIQKDDNLFEIIHGVDVEEIKEYDFPAKVLAREISESEELILSLSELHIPEDQDWAKAQREDPWYMYTIRWIETGELPDNDKQASWILSNAPSYAIGEGSGILLKTTTINDNERKTLRCVPQKWRKLICALVHDSNWVAAHMGRDKTYLKMKERFYFPNMKEYVSAYVAICPACQLTKKSKLNPKIPMGTIEADAVWDLVCIDVWDSGKTTPRGNKYVLTVIDAFSKFAIPIPLKGKSAEEVAEALYTLIGDKGPMSRLHSDQGGEFCNEVLEHLTKIYQINKIRTTAYHPMGNAFAERIHQFYKNALTSIVKFCNRDWDTLIPALQLAYNTAIHSAIGKQPYQVFYGRECPPVDMILDTVKLPEHSAMTYADKITWALHKTQEILMDNLARKQAIKNAQNADLQVPNYNTGDLVKLQYTRVKPGEGKKLKLAWSGPYKISRRERNDKVYYLSDELGNELLKPVSVARIMPWNSPKDFPILEKDKYEGHSEIAWNAQFHESSSTSEEHGEKFQPRDDPNYVPPIEEDTFDSDPIPVQVREELKTKEQKQSDIGVLSNVKVPFGKEHGFTKKTVGIETDINSQGEIVLKQRLLPSHPGKRQIKKPKRFRDEI